MKTVLLLIFLLIIIFLFTKNESFEDDDTCKKIPHGECKSTLCPSECKIQHSTTSDQCYCAVRK